MCGAGRRSASKARPIALERRDHERSVCVCVESTMWREDMAASSIGIVRFRGVPGRDSRSTSYPFREVAERRTITSSSWSNVSLIPLFSPDDIAASSASFDG